ncbi:MAG: MerR family transcriptional regulator [Spirochaetales bacterium]|nr:MerR family transcriptional regulator [Spirochaetales bacterium]
MKKYTIGEVSDILQLKPHVLRYWEKEFSFLKPAKSATGRRVYSERDVHLLFRLKYLLYTRRFTMEGAKQKIWEELSAPNADLKSVIHELRGDILKLRTKITDNKRKQE